MSRNGSYAKSMNGIVSFDDGDGTTIEGSEINTETINCNTLTASSIINTDYIDSNTNTYIQCLSDITFNGEVSASFVPTSNNQLCNKLYVDTVAAAGSSILPLTNVFTGTSNTFNNSLITNNIVQKSSGSSAINIYNTLSTNSIINMFSDTTNTYNGLINICSGAGVQVPSMNIMVGDPNTFYGYKTLKIGDQYTRTTLNSSIDISTDNISALDNTTSKDIFKFNTGDITIGKTGKILLGEDISIKQKTIQSTGTTDIINLFNNISGTIGQINIAGKFVIKELSIASTSITDNVSLFNNLSGAFGVVKMATNLLFKQSNILSSAVGDVINLFTNLTTGTLNIGTGITTGILNIGTEITTGTLNLATGVMTGILNIGTGITTGMLYIGSDITTGDIFIGNTSGTTAGALGDITMGNGSNNNNTTGNGRVIINKLRIGNSPILRNIRYGTVGGGSQSAVVNFSPAFPSGQVPFIVGNIQSSLTTQVFSLTFSSVTNTSFRYTKNYIGSAGVIAAASSESFDYYAWSD
jgi:hypothetical protein